MKIDIQTLSSDPTLLYTGPPLDAGPRPTLFYFTLSAKDSLQTPPFNQCVQFLQNSPIRIFSVTLPGHEGDDRGKKSVQMWAESMKRGEPILPVFFDRVKKSIDNLLAAHLIVEGKLAVAGLSRGAFIASHIAAICPEVKTLLGFAPMTRLSFAKEFCSICHEDAVTALDLDHLIPKLDRKTVRFYIGNIDTRVSTEHCFSLIYQLAKSAKANRIASPPIELIITPSIGHNGHGTSQEVFEKGADWIKQELLS